MFERCFWDCLENDFFFFFTLFLRNAYEEKTFLRTYQACLSEQMWILWRLSRSSWCQCENEILCLLVKTSLCFGSVFNRIPLHRVCCKTRYAVVVLWHACNLTGAPFPVVPGSEAVGSHHMLPVSWVPDSSVEAECWQSRVVAFVLKEASQLALQGSTFLGAPILSWGRSWKGQNTGSSTSWKVSYLFACLQG